MRLGALEAGGTKMVCAIGDETGKVLHRESYPTLEPENTIPAILNYFKDKNIQALGIGSFGPLNLDPTDPAFGSITTTPKPGWANYPLRHRLMEALKVPVGIDTDVNAAALAEARLGAGKGLKEFGVLYDRDRHRWRRNGRGPAASRIGASGNGAYSFEARSARPCSAWLLSLPRWLLGGHGQWTSH